MWPRTVLFTAILALVPATDAAAVNFYIGAGLGESVDLASDDLDLGDFGTDSDDRTWKLFGGVGLGRVFGVEAAWHDFGTVTCCDQVADAGFTLDAEGISVAAVVGIPISRLRLFAKGGLFSWKVDGELLTIIGPSPFSDDGEDVMGGVGADLKLWKRWSVRAEWEIFRIDDGEIDTLSLGVQYRFQ